MKAKIELTYSEVAKVLEAHCRAKLGDGFVSYDAAADGYRYEGWTVEAKDQAELDSEAKAEADREARTAKRRAEPVELAAELKQVEVL